VPKKPEARRHPPAVVDATTARTAEVQAWLADLMARADQGDTVALADLKRAYDAVPTLCHMYSGLRENAERTLLDAMVPAQLGAQELIVRQLEAMRRDLAGPDPSPLERLLVDRVVLCWLFATYADTRYAMKLKEGLTFREGEYYQRAAERAQRQLLRATQTLATVRRLLAPVAQINIADQQINVAR
jgi:hypothetical protein